MRCVAGQKDIPDAIVPGLPIVYTKGAGPPGGADLDAHSNVIDGLLEIVDGQLAAVAFFLLGVEGNDHPDARVGNSAHEYDVTAMGMDGEVVLRRIRTIQFDVAEKVREAYTAAH